MYRISLACGHSRLGRLMGDMPGKGEQRYCFLCKGMRETSVDPYWHGRCRNCRWSRTFLVRPECARAADRHMLNQRHTIMCYQSHDMEGTVFVVQPATSAQTRIEIVEKAGWFTQKVVSEVEEPPPF